MIDRIPVLWAVRGWLARGMEGPRFYSGVQRLVGSRALWTRFVAEVVRPAPGLRVLDVGCGPADVLPFLPADVSYLGIDPHPPYVERARRRHGARGSFRVAAVEDLVAEATERFDVVLVTGVLHHLDDAAARGLLAAAAELVAPSGRLVALETLRAPGQSLLERQFYVVDRGRHVRDDAGYRALFAGPVRTTVWPRALRVPYTYVVIEAGPTPPAGPPRPPSARSPGRT